MNAPPPRLVLWCVILLAFAHSICRAAQLGVPIVYVIEDTVMFRDGTGGKPLTIDKGIQPSLAPGGRQIVWVASKDAPNDCLRLRDMDTGKTTTLAKPGGSLQTPRWSPKGDAVVFARYNGQNELWVVRPGGRPVRLATASATTGNEFNEPIWSPDGTYITYHDMAHLCQLTLDGKVASRLDLASLRSGEAEVASGSDRCVFRPGDEKLLLCSMSVPGSPLFQKKIHNSSSALFLYDTSTKQVARITGETLTAFSPVWLPNGEEMLFCGYTDAQAGEKYPLKVYVMRPGDAPVELFPGTDPMPAASSK